MTEIPPQEQVSFTPGPQPQPAPTIIVAPPPAPKRNRLFWGMLSGCFAVFVLFTILSVAVAMFADNSTNFSFPGGARIAVLPIEGEIVESRHTIDLLHRYRDDESVKGIVIRINSPGGAIAPSQEIYEEIRLIRRESKKPIVASLDSVAASGGYYIAVACDSIVANRGSITGSIGVIAQWMTVKDLLAWAKIQPTTVTSGKLKDAGSPFKEFTPEDRAYYQAIIAQLHSQFIRAVAAGREGKLTQAEIIPLADGRIFTGEDAMQKKLVDQLGTLQDAIRATATLAGIKGKPDVLYPRPRREGLADLLSEMRSAVRVIAPSVEQPSPFFYRW